MKKIIILFVSIILWISFSFAVTIPLELSQIGGYYGIDLSKQSSSWLRTTSNGILPFDSTASSSLGSNSWRFNQAHINTIYEGESKLSSKYTTQSGISSVNNLTLNLNTLETSITPITNEITKTENIGIREIPVIKGKAFVKTLEGKFTEGVGWSNGNLRIDSKSADLCTVSGIYNDVGTYTVTLSDKIFIFKVINTPTNLNVNININ